MLPFSIVLSSTPGMWELRICFTWWTKNSQRNYNQNAEGYCVFQSATIRREMVFWYLDADLSDTQEVGRLW